MPSVLPAEEAVRVEAGAGGREDVQEGVDGGGRVAQVQEKIYKILEERRTHKQHKHGGYQ